MLFIMLTLLVIIGLTSIWAAVHTSKYPKVWTGLTVGLSCVLLVIGNVVTTLL